MTRQIYAEDLAVGDEFEVGVRTLDEQEIIAFAREWDPQIFHIDPVAARDTFFGELVASGLQTIAVLQRMIVEAQFSKWAVQAGRSIRVLDFNVPVTPGMRLTGRLRVEEIRMLRPTSAALKHTGELRDDSGRVVCSMTVDCFIERRPTQG